MDDVDAAEASQARNIVLSHDWVTQRLNGTLYLDKAPLKYWLTAILYRVLGVHDWVARLPTAIAAILLCWLVVRMGRWAFSAQAGFNAGLVLATSVGLFLFTRTIIPDVLLTLLITLSICCFARAMEDGRRSNWALGMWAAMGLAVLTKGFIGVVFPAAIAVVYLLLTKQWTASRRLLRPVPGVLLFLAIAAPWHVLATLHNPPVLDFSLHVGPHFGGKFRGFFWFYFINEQLLRFLNERWPKDYDTVPRVWFWLAHLVWFFPWSFYLPAVATESFRNTDRAGRMCLLAICWITLVMVFFTFSTTQEYYSMPIYPAIALLLGSVMTGTSRWLGYGAKAAGVVSLIAAFAIAAILIQVWSLTAAGDIYSALSQHPTLYKLSLGHMADLTIPAFAYLKLPLALAGMSFLLGGAAALFLTGQLRYIAVAVTLVLFFQAARFAQVVFDPYLSSSAVAQELNQLPLGTVIVCGKYNPLSSVFFYSRDGALLNSNNLDILEYGSLAPGAPKIQLDDDEMKHLWNGPKRVYVIAKAPEISHVESVLGPSAHLLLHSADKYLFANH